MQRRKKEKTNFSEDCFVVGDDTDAFADVGVVDFRPESERRSLASNASDLADLESQQETSEAAKANDNVWKFVAVQVLGNAEFLAGQALSTAG